MATIQGIYIALFGRPADPTGLAYFNGVTGNGANLTAIGDLASTDEYQDRFEGKSNVEIIIDIYQSLFGRNPDQAGLTFFSEALASGRQTVNTIAINILDGAQNEDLAVINNKIEAADAFTAALDEPDEVAAYNGNQAAELGRQFLLPITADAASIPDTAAVDAAIDNIGTIGNTQELTEGVDVLTGTIFNAPRGFTPGGTDQVNTLNDDDVLTGTGTNATLNLSFVNDADTGDGSIAPTLNNIANVNVNVRTDFDSVLDLQDSTGVQNIKVNGVDEADFTLDNIQEALKTAVVEDSNDEDSGVQFLHVDSALKGTADAVALTLSNVQLEYVAIQEGFGSGDQGYETITLESTGSANKLEQLFAEDLQTLVITGDEDLALGNRGPGTAEFIDTVAGLANVAGSLTKIDASALTGSLEINLGAEVTANVDGKSGTKVDFTLIGTAQDDTIRLLSGFDSKGDNIDGGGGKDRLVVFSSVANGTVTAVEDLDVRSNALVNGGAAITVDASLFTGLTSIMVRDEGGAGPTTLDKLTSDLINNISIQHGITGSNDVASNVLVANLLTQTATDTAKFTFADQLDGEDRLINTDPRFNQTISADKVESITLVDNDTESNTFLLTEGAELSGALTLTGGAAGNFLNLDATANLYGLDQSGKDVDLFGLAGSTVSTVNAAASIVDVGAGAAERFSAAKIDASAYLGDVVVRVDTLRDAAGVALPGGGQSILMGAGNDTVVFDFLGDTTAGLSISDTVKGGEGLDTLGIDGNGVKINLSASEWTNVSGFETVRLVGNGVAGTNLATTPGANDAYGANSYNLTLTNDLITNNGAAVTGGRRVDIVNDNDLANDKVGVADTGGTGVESGVTIDARGLSATNNFSYNGEEGASRTADRFILSDANVNGLALIDGGAVLGGGNVASNLTNDDVLEVRNAAVVTVGDLSGLKNIGTIEFTNDQAASQPVVLQLDNATIDALVNSSQAATSLATAETLFVNAFDNPLIPGAFTTLSLDMTQVTNAFLNVVVTADGGADVIKLGAGNDVINGGAGSDTLTGGAGADDFLLLDQVKGPGVVEADTITDFSVAAPDQLQFDVSDLGEFDTANGKELIKIADAAANIAGGDSVDLVKIAAATDLGTVAGNVLVLDGNFANAAAVEAAIINGGTQELKFNGDFDKGDSFLVVYDDGANTHIALVTATDTTANDAKIADATKIDTVDLVTLTGVADATTLTNANFLTFDA